MEHTNDLTGLAFVVLTALACGTLMARFRQPPLVGPAFCWAPPASSWLKVKA